MPIYTYKCCGQTKDQYSSIANRHTGPECPECGEAMQMKIVPPMVHVPNWDAYKCPMSGELVTSERKRRDVMARHDLIDANDLDPPPVGEAA